MSVEPTKPWPELLPLLRELIRLRRRELDLLRRLERQMLLLSAMTPPAPAGHGGAEGTDGDEVAAEGAPALTAAEEAGGPGPDPAADRDWIDRTIEAALARAFSGAPPVEAMQDEETEGALAPAIDPELLLVRGGEAWVGFPWESVEGIGLTDEDGPAPAARLSLRSLLEVAGDDGPAVEPYRVAWDHGGQTADLTCEALGGVIPASAAASRGLELVVAPLAAGDPHACRVVTLVEYLAEAAAIPGAAVEPWPVTVEVADPRTEPTAPAEPAVPAASRVLAAPVEPAAPAPPAVPDTAAAIEASTELDLATALRRPVVVENAPEAAGAPAATPRSAIVAVRYLPARVAVTRVLRSLGWEFTELADPEEVPSLLPPHPPAALFVEPPERQDAAWIESLRQARGAGTHLFVVGSRLRGRAVDPLASLGEVSRLLYPFQEWEIDRLVRALRGTAPPVEPVSH